MMTLVPVSDEVLRFEEETGRSWILKEDDDGRPMWVEIKDDEIKEKTDA